MARVEPINPAVPVTNIFIFPPDSYSSHVGLIPKRAAFSHSADIFFNANENLALCQIILFYGRRSEEHTSELQSRENLVCRLLLEKKKKRKLQKLTESVKN